MKSTLTNPDQTAMMLSMQNKTSYFYFFGHIKRTPQFGERLALPD
jgi:hypothetical protein